MGFSEALQQIMFAASGAAILVVTTMEAVRTTVRVGGTGGVTARLWLRLKWSRVFRRVMQWPALRTTTGVSALVATLLGWSFAIWLGWALIFLSTPGSVLNDTTRLPADAWATIYYAGFAFITLGVGDYSPGSPAFQMLSVVASINGFFIITLGITYIGPLLAAVEANRTLAKAVDALGGSGAAIVKRAWNGEDLGQLDQHLINLTPHVVGLGERYQAYPMLHCFVPEAPEVSAVRALAVLHDLTLLLRLELAESARADLITVQALDRAMEHAVNVLAAGRRSESSGLGPPNPRAFLEGSGVPLVSSDRPGSLSPAATDTRSALVALLKQEGQDWPHGERV